jgi:hypothetical protein
MSSRSMSRPLVLPAGVDKDFPLWLVEEEDGSWTVHWDGDHPATSCFNGWTGEMFVAMAVSRALEVLR